MIDSSAWLLHSHRYRRKHLGAAERLSNLPGRGEPDRMVFRMGHVPHFAMDRESEDAGFQSHWHARVTAIAGSPRAVPRAPSLEESKVPDVVHDACLQPRSRCWVA